MLFYLLIYILVQLYWCYCGSDSLLTLTLLLLLWHEQMEQSDWWEVPLTMKDVWRCTTTTHGALCVMTVGTLLMPLWSADSSITVELCLHFDMPTLVQAAVQSITTKLLALGPRHAWLTALILVLESATVDIMKMLQCGVTLCHVSRL